MSNLSPRAHLKRLTSHPPNNPGAALDPNNPSTPTLFHPLKIRNVTLKNRIIVAPMCMFSCEPDPSHPAVGALTDWHVAHLGHLAAKGVGLVIIEATAVTPSGRISPQDSGLWQGIGSEQWKALKRVVDFVHAQGCKVGLQLAQAGRKSSTVAPWLVPKQSVKGERGRRTSWRADGDPGGWPCDVVAPTGGDEYKWAPGDEQFWAPRELSALGIKETVEAFAQSAKTAINAGIDVIEVHAAHGYLLHEFLSPVTNRRTDCYGGSFDNRVRIVREVLTAIRAVIPQGTPLSLRISATDCLEEHPISTETGSWDIASSIRLAKLLPELGRIQPPGHSGYQVDMAGQIRREIHAAGQKTLIGAVGLIKEDIVQGADAVRQSGDKAKADVVLMARQFMREPYWVFAAAKKLNVPVSLTLQFGRALL
ncbi:uncharacterized protein BDV14DRAFT_186796 [Aspergillus stella-maris]|uniref:uncharacterized protein n=1 Tax=Aspergillus stella-maris TaxID=1810926 RepID=UPI003CCD81BD